MRINTNAMALNGHRNLTRSQNQLGKSLEKLSSGFRINRAGDDAAGLVISENLRSQVGGMKQAVRNAQDGVSVVQTAEGALTEVHSMLQRVRDLAVQASNTGANGGATSSSVAAAQAEVDQLVDQIDQIASTTKFNGQNLLNSTGSLTFQVGANGGETISLTLRDMDAAALTMDTLKSTGGASLASGPSGAIAVVDAAISAVSSFRGQLGATQNRLEHTINNLQVSVENLSASESRIRDTDMAAEMTNFTRNQIMSQAGTSMLAQANSVPQGVLSLLG